MRWDVVVVGAGAAGLLAAARAAECGRRTLLLEKNRRPGIKILMSGGTRCNLTHATDARGIVAAFGPGGRFLHSALAALGPRELVELIESEGVPTKVEATGKIFPVSNQAADVLDALLRRLNRSGTELAIGEPVTKITHTAEGFRIITDHRELTVPVVILTTGGKSYPGSGTTGDGYRWAEALGHTIVPPRPALTPVAVTAEWVRSLRGVTLPEVALQLVETAAPGKVLARRRGSFLFTHFGLSGPAVMDLSGTITAHPRPQSLELLCDFLPEVSERDIDDWLKQESAASGRKLLAGVLAERVPRRLAEAVLALVGLPVDRTSAALSRQDRKRITTLLKKNPIAVAGTLGYAKAEVTAGGVALDEVDSRTMQSKLVPGLYFAGEILDLDGPIGGYNFQSAFSTGWLAGASVTAPSCDRKSP